MKSIDVQYKELLQRIMQNGFEHPDRTGIGRKSLAFESMAYDVSPNNFPVITTKKVAMKAVIEELMWFVRGETNIQPLVKAGVTIWDEWPFKNYTQSRDYTGPDMTNMGVRKEEDEAFRHVYLEEIQRFREKIIVDDAFAQKYGELGSVYGKHWRNWEAEGGGSIDQLREVVENIKKDPYSTRHVVNSWRPETQNPEKAALPACHTLFQFVVTNGVLDGGLWQRSGDVFLGIPFNVMSYGLLTNLVAREVGLQAGSFTHVIADAHLYSNHYEQAQTLIEREPKGLPQLKIHGNKSMFELETKDIEIVGYESHGKIKAPVAI